VQGSSSRQSEHPAANDEPHRALGPYRTECHTGYASPSRSANANLPSDHHGPRHVMTSGRDHTQRLTTVEGPGPSRMVQRLAPTCAQQPTATLSVGTSESSMALHGCVRLEEELDHTRAGTPTQPTMGCSNLVAMSRPLNTTGTSLLGRSMRPMMEQEFCSAMPLMGNIRRHTHRGQPRGRWKPSG
jgi:hypothetical protein